MCNNKPNVKDLKDIFDKEKSNIDSLPSVLSQLKSKTAISSINFK